MQSFKDLIFIEDFWIWSSTRFWKKTLMPILIPVFLNKYVNIWTQPYYIVQCRHNARIDFRDAWLVNFILIFFHGLWPIISKVHRHDLKTKFSLLFFKKKKKHIRCRRWLRWVTHGNRASIIDNPLIRTCARMKWEKPD